MPGIAQENARAHADIYMFARNETTCAPRGTKQHTDNDARDRIYIYFVDMLWWTVPYKHGFSLQATGVSGRVCFSDSSLDCPNLA